MNKNKILLLSILCQEDPYLLELVCYIHLNPLRARLVDNIEINEMTGGRFDPFSPALAGVKIIRTQPLWMGKSEGLFEFWGTGLKSGSGCGNRHPNLRRFSRV